MSGVPSYKAVKEGDGTCQPENDDGQVEHRLPPITTSQHNSLPVPLGPQSVRSHSRVTGTYAVHRPRTTVRLQTRSRSRATRTRVPPCADDSMLSDAVRSVRSSSRGDAVRGSYAAGRHSAVTYNVRKLSEEYQKPRGDITVGSPAGRRSARSGRTRTARIGQRCKPPAL
jgi:hypothetical protein